MANENTIRVTKHVHYPWTCYFVGIAMICYLLLAIGALLVIHLNLFAFLGEASLLRAHSMCAAFGMLGATVATMRRYYGVLIADVVRDDESQSIWSFGWVYYYLTRPLLGSVLGGLTYTLSFIGVQVLAEPKDVTLAAEGMILLYGIAFASGYSASRVLNRIEEVSRQIFQSESSSKRGGP